MPESCTELSTSFALASEGSCTWLSSLVSLACSSGLVVIHGAIPILRLMRRSSYLIVNQEIRDRPSQKTSRYPVHPAASKENNQAEKLFPHRTPTSPASKPGFLGLAGAAQGSAQAEKAQAFQAQGDSYNTRAQPAELRVAPLGPQRLTRARPRARRGCGREGWKRVVFQGPRSCARPGFWRSEQGRTRSAQRVKTFRPFEESA